MFNHAFDVGYETDFNCIVYVRDGVTYEYDKWKHLSFQTLEDEGEFFIKEDSTCGNSSK